EDNRPVVENIIDAIAKGGDQVKSYSAALNKAGEISAAVYKEETGPYWVKYYNGVSQADKQGQVVELGGSRVHNLGDNLELFGMGQGSTNVYKIVYTLFGDVTKQLYPKLMPTYPAADEVIDLSYLKAVAGRTTTIAEADKLTFNADDGIREKVAEKSWNIEFLSGSNKLTPASQKVLQSLFNDLVVASNLRVELHGHTDNLGDAAKNRQLSEDRAFAVKQWLEAKSATNFPDGRIAVIAHGSDNPLVPNSTPVGRAKNRRVTVVMGK
ncbi:MAG: OmpA family protein, partial [Cytophagaceae bacterium]